MQTVLKFAYDYNEDLSSCAVRVPEPKGFQIVISGGAYMQSFARVVLFSSVLSLGVAFAESLPNPFFPPDPDLPVPPAAVMMADQESLPNPFFPPDPDLPVPPAAMMADQESLPNPFFPPDPDLPVPPAAA